VHELLEPAPDLRAALPRRGCRPSTRFARHGRHPPLFKGRARRRAETPSVVHRSFEHSARSVASTISWPGDPSKLPHPFHIEVALATASNVSRALFAASSPRPHDPFEPSGGCAASTSWRRLQPTFFSFQRRSSTSRAATSSLGDRSPSACQSSVFVHGETLGFGGPVVTVEPLRLLFPARFRPNL
jgi:hypothetical protein